MEELVEIATALFWLLAIALLWSSAAKLLPGGGLAASAEMAWATRPGLASGTIAGVVEFIAAAVLVLTALDVVATDMAAVIVGFGIAAHMGVAAMKHVEAGGEESDAEAADGGSRLPNLVLGVLGLLVAIMPLVN